MINTSSRVKPRVVIFHITASQLVRSIAPLCKARAVPNTVAHVSAENGDVWRKFDQLEGVESRKCRSHAERTAAAATIKRLESAFSRGMIPALDIRLKSTCFQGVSACRGVVVDSHPTEIRNLAEPTAAIL